MAFTRLDIDLNNVQKLQDIEQNQAAMVKQTFDKAGNDIKTYVNDTLISELEADTDGSSGADSIGATEIAPGSGNKVMAILKWLYTQITNVVLGQIPDGAITDAKLSNTAGQIKDTFNSHMSDTLYQTAGGTATVITLTGVVLENGHSKTFIASANNNGSATTINGKPLYKPNTTTAPTLIAGKAYTVWYNSIGDCFFIKASAEGNVTADKVLAGYTYSSDEDTGKLGAMPNRGTFNLPLGAVVPAGYYSGGSVPNGKRYFASSSYASSTTQFEITGLSFSPNFLIATMESGLDKTNSFVCYFTNGNIIGKIYALFGGTLKEMQIADATKLSDGIRIDTTSDDSIFGTSYKYNWIAIE